MTRPRVPAAAVGYVALVAAANLVIAAYGAAAVPIVSFLAIGGVIVVRDRLHDRWQGRGLTVRMGALVAAGAAVTVAVQVDAAAIAVASAVAFAASETVNAVVYQPMLRRLVPWLRRVNVGNVANATVDSVVFVALAFGLDWAVIGLQVAAKVAGGAMWSLLLARAGRP